MQILILGLKKRTASFLDKRLKSEGFATLVAPSSSGLPGSDLSEDLDLAVIDAAMLSDEDQDLLREVAARNPGLPMVLIATGNNDGVAYYRDLGFVPHVLKEPYSLNDLTQRIREILPVVPEDGARILRAGDVSVDLTSRTVTAGDKAVSLTPKEMSLFEYFLKNSNQVLSRQLLLKDVWGYDFETDSNVVDVYVRYLREKLGTIGKKDLIETVRGAGYRVTVFSQVQAQQKRALQVNVVTWTAVFATILLAAGLFITYLTGSIAVQRTQGPNFEQIASQTANKTDLVLRNEIGMLVNLSVAPDVRDALSAFDPSPFVARSASDSVQGLRGHIKEIRDLQPNVISDITIVSRAGRLVASTNPKAPGQQRNTAWFKGAKGLKKGTVGLSDITYLRGRPVLELFTPVYDGGRLVGSLKMTTELQGLFASITRVALGKTGHTMLVDSKGVVVICPILAPRSHEVSRPLLAAITGAPSGSMITDEGPIRAEGDPPGHGGRNTVAGFAAVPITLGEDASGVKGFGNKTWHILITQNPAETYAHVYTSLWRAFGLGVTVVVLLTLLAYVLGRRIIRPSAPKRHGSGR